MIILIVMKIIVLVQSYVQGIVEEERTEWEFGNKEKIKTLQKEKKNYKKGRKRNGNTVRKEELKERKKINQKMTEKKRKNGKSAKEDSERGTGE